MRQPAAVIPHAEGDDVFVVPRTAEVKQKVTKAKKKMPGSSLLRFLRSLLFELI